MDLYVKFRPSSHSTDLTIVATFDDEAKACEAAKKVVEPRCRIVNNHVVVTISEATDYEARKMRKQMRTNGAVKNRTYDNQYYQEATVLIRIPKGMTTNTLPLILNDGELKALKELERCCGTPRIAIEGNDQVWTFKYMGEERFGDENSSWAREPYMFPKGKTVFRDRVTLGRRFKLQLYGVEWRRRRRTDDNDDGTLSGRRNQMKP